MLTATKTGQFISLFIFSVCISENNEDSIKKKKLFEKRYSYMNILKVKFLLLILKLQSPKTTANTIVVIRLKKLSISECIIIVFVLLLQ